MENFYGTPILFRTIDNLATKNIQRIFLQAIITLSIKYYGGFDSPNATYINPLVLKISFKTPKNTYSIIKQGLSKKQYKNYKLSHFSIAVSYTGRHLYTSFNILISTTH